MTEEGIMEAVLVGLQLKDTDDFSHHMDEMVSLIEACEIKVIARAEQNLPAPNPSTYIGSGKLLELAEIVENMGADYLIFSDNLSPAQLKNIQRSVEAVVMDRTSLILEIFAKRARTREARLQVEMANLQYMLPRLVGMRASLGRQGGASGSMSNKGTGEKQIELDRRRIEKRISELRRELDSIGHDREVQRKARTKGNLPHVALVGYTNAGKSTLMNHLVGMSGKSEEKQVFEKDMLFATLDTTIRRISTGDKKDFLLADTVGFVSNLPHDLVKAFRTTLEEVKLADLLLIVLDSSDIHCLDHLKITEDTLKILDADRIERIYVMNKADRLIEDGEMAYETTLKHPASIPMIIGDRIYISASKEIGIAELLNMIREKIYSGNRIMHLIIPYKDGSLVSILNENAQIISQNYTAEGTDIIVDCPPHLIGKLSSYLIEE